MNRQSTKSSLQTLPNVDVVNSAIHLGRDAPQEESPDIVYAFPHSQPPA